MDQRRAGLLEAMALERYVLRGGPADRVIEPVIAPTVAVAAPLPTPTTNRPATATVRSVRPLAAPAPGAAAGLQSPPETADLDWAGLEAAVAGCRRCGLCEARTQTVFGVGDRAARWLIVGEAPGPDEEREGEPFVGRVGQLLNAMLQSIGHPRPTVYIANVLKCRPPSNQDPTPEQVRQCLPNLQRQIELVAPDLILCVGRVAAQNLLGVDTPLAQLRGKVHRFGAAERAVVVTYHPAYLLRSPSEKRKAWIDLQFALEVANGRRAAI
ncbi:MAG: uracil-DNA glycosylase [Pseudomonadota bacterium]